ncbi:MAG: hypothetical protein MZV64_14820 [Ignavibacteriales bacterium]|nr:hypothetical protein [Ignavibacteriales bacterium]
MKVRVWTAFLLLCIRQKSRLKTSEIEYSRLAPNNNGKKTKKSVFAGAARRVFGAGSSTLEAIVPDCARAYIFMP